MRSLSRVVWSEGMHLAQHHFQAQSRYFEDLADFALSNLYFEPWGLLGLELNAEALYNGTVSLTHARGIMPDGLAFQFPQEPPPEPLEIQDRFSPTQDSHLVRLAIPAYRPDRANCPPSGADSNGSARFRPVTLTVLDEGTGRDAKDVAVARGNFRLILDGEPDDGLVTLPLARIRRDGSGHFIYDPEYIPPCLRISASTRIMEILSRLVDVLDAKAEAIAAERRGAPGMVAGYASSEVASFWLSHAVHSAVAPLRHHLRARSVHPEALYTELVRLAGALCTFSLESHPRDLPLYDHDTLERTFGDLDRHIRKHLDLVVPTNAIRIPLRQADTSLFAGTVADQRCFGRAHWFLGVRSAAPAADVIARVPRLVKICSARHIVRLVKEGLPGLQLAHVTSPPADLSPRIGTHYFSIGKAEPCWKSIVETGEAGIYVPAGIPDAELELVVVLEP